MLDPDSLRRMGGAMSMAAELAVTVTLGVFAGAWLDARLHTEPFLLLALALLALIVGFVRLTRTMQRSDSSDDGDPPNHRS